MKRLFFTGLIVLLPFIITYIILGFLVGFITSPFERLIVLLLGHFELFQKGVGIFSQAQLIYVLSKLFVLLTLIVLIFVVGILAHWMTVHSLHSIADRIVRKIPFINKIYSACKECTDILFAPKDKKDERAAIVPYPSESEKSLGLVVHEVETDVVPYAGKNFVIVLLPCTPNPTVGYLCAFPKEQVTFVNLPRQEALKYIISCGAMPLPDQLKISID